MCIVEVRTASYAVKTLFEKRESDGTHNDIRVVTKEKAARQTEIFLGFAVWMIVRKR